MKNRNAFTLVEILVIFIILGILMAIVIPQMTKINFDTRKADMLEEAKNAGEVWFKETPKGCSFRVKSASGSEVMYDFPKGYMSDSILLGEGFVLSDAEPKDGWKSYVVKKEAN